MVFNNFLKQHFDNSIQSFYNYLIQNEDYKALLNCFTEDDKKEVFISILDSYLENKLFGLYFYDKNILYQIG